MNKTRAKHMAFQCRKRQCYTRDVSFVPGPQAKLLAFQCRKRQFYTRDPGVKWRLAEHEKFQCRKRQFYTRDIR